MMNLNLLNNEKIIHKIDFSKRIIFIDILLSLAIFSLAQNQGKESIIAFILMLIFLPLFIKTIFDFYRIFFHKVFITNKRVIYIKGYIFRRVKVFQLEDIIAVYFKSSILDWAKNMTTFKVKTKNTTIIIKNIKEGKKVADLLSIHLKQKINQMHKNNII